MVLKELRRWMAALLIAMPTVAFVLPVGRAQAESVIRSTATFTPPSECKQSRRLAKAVGAVIACEQRFSQTHEFAIMLLEKRYQLEANSNTAARRVMRKYVSDLKKANVRAPGQKLGMFEASESVANAKLPKGAEACTLVDAMVFDRRVPGHVGEEFRIWMESHVCVRVDSASNTVQLVELRASERFRVATDGAVAVPRFKNLIPSVTLGKAYDTLKLF